MTNADNLNSYFAKLAKEHAFKGRLIKFRAGDRIVFEHILDNFVRIIDHRLTKLEQIVAEIYGRN